MRQKERDERNEKFEMINEKWEQEEKKGEREGERAYKTETTVSGEQPERAQSQ